MLICFSGGHLMQAMRENPLGFVTLGLLATWVMLGCTARILGRDLLIEVSAKDKKWFVPSLVTAFLLNWVYLWVTAVAP